jgi:hypothetical protein
MSESSDSSPFDLSKFDPSTIDLSFLRPEEQNRIRAHQYDSRELSLLLQRKNPWTRSGKPEPLPSPMPLASTPDEDFADRSDRTGVPAKPQLPQPPNAIDVFNAFAKLADSDIGKFWTPRPDQQVPEPSEAKRSQKNDLVRIASDEDVAEMEKIRETFSKDQRDRELIQAIDAHQRQSKEPQPNPDNGPSFVGIGESKFSEPSWHKRPDLVLAIILFCFGGVLAIGLVLLPPTSSGAIIFWLAIMFSLLAACELFLAHFFDLSKPKAFAGLLVPAALVALFGCYIWPPNPRQQPDQSSSQSATQSQVVQLSPSQIPKVLASPTASPSLAAADQNTVPSPSPILTQVEARQLATSSPSPSSLTSPRVRASPSPISPSPPADNASVSFDRTVLIKGGSAHQT